MRISDSEPIYPIGRAARKVGLSVPTLRLYEKEGLIVPVRTSTNRRFYSISDLRIIETTQHLIHEHGLNFAGIRRLMAFLPCWKIKGCDPALYRRCKVPYVTEGPCWSSGLAVERQWDGDCQSCPVYHLAGHVDHVSIQDLAREQKLWE
jgi:MerR family transcriptional regulator/heat shock protein HspR